MMNQMEPIRDYFSLPDSKHIQRSSWDNDWSSPWETSTPAEMPLWQYNTDTQHHGLPQIAYYPNESPITPYTDPRSGAPSTNPSPVTGYTHDGRFAPLTPIYDPTAQPPNSLTPPIHHPQLPVQELIESGEANDVMEDDDSEGYIHEASRSPNAPSATSKKPSHRRTQSANEITLKNAKRAHTVVERNYRERLNDKIADLALYLFETSSDSRTKPSKSLVMTRAKERLKQLEARNKALESEVAKLRQHIAILDHVVASKGGESTPAPS